MRRRLRKLYCAATDFHRYVEKVAEYEGEAFDVDAAVVTDRSSATGMESFSWVWPLLSLSVDVREQFSLGGHSVVQSYF
jgi:hypothetical protein